MSTVGLLIFIVVPTTVTGMTVKVHAIHAQIHFRIRVLKSPKHRMNIMPKSR